MTQRYEETMSCDRCHHHMEDLLLSWSQKMTLSNTSIPNDSSFSLLYDANTQRVLANEFILAGSCLGQIYGIPMYIWDISHYDYMFVDEDMVLDVSQNVPRTMLTFVRDDNLSESPKNCVIHVEQDDTTFQTHFYLYATCDIHVGDEIVNAIPSYRS